MYLKKKKQNKPMQTKSIFSTSTGCCCSLTLVVYTGYVQGNLSLQPFFFFTLSKKKIQRNKQMKLSSQKLSCF